MEDRLVECLEFPGDNGWVRLSNYGLSRLDVTTTGVDVYGAFIGTTTGVFIWNFNLQCLN